jgi:hypothetical protein
MSDYLIDQSAEIYCHGIARIDKLGPNRRIIFTVPNIHSDGEQIVAAKLIMPAELMMVLARMAAGADETILTALIAHDMRTAN